MKKYKRIFIISPHLDAGDTLWQVCGTNENGRLGDIYIGDLYEEIKYVESNTKDKAVKWAKKYGAKRPTII